MRHPFYVSYSLFWIGWAVGVWSPWALLAPLVLVPIYVAAARGEERKFARSEMAEQYRRYMREVGFFFPRLAR